MDLKAEIKQVRAYIVKNQIEKAIDNLISIKTSILQQNIDELLLFKANYFQILKDESINIITNEHSTLNRNKLNNAILQYTSNLEQELDSLKEKTDIEYRPLTDEELLEYYSQEELLKDEIGLSEMPSIPQVVVFKSADFPKLGYGEIKVCLDEAAPVYEIPSRIRTKAVALIQYHKENNKGKTFYDAKTTRLNKIEMLDKGLRIYISKASYFAYLGTNFSMDIKLKGWRNSLRNFLHKDGKLVPLKYSSLANHIGIGALVFTSDNFLVLQQRPLKGVSIRGGELAPSVSGASEFKDFSLNRENYLVNFLLREAEEELGIDLDCIDVSSIRLLGIVRELLRGGKPEMFFSAQLKIDYQELKSMTIHVKDSWETGNIVGFEFGSDEVINKPWENRPEIDEALLNIKADFGKMSLPLITNLLLWRNLEK